jgi:hypothetical protein
MCPTEATRDRVVVGLEAKSRRTVFDPDQRLIDSAIAELSAAVWDKATLSEYTRILCVLELGAQRMYSQRPNRCWAVNKAGCAGFGTPCRYCDPRRAQLSASISASEAAWGVTVPIVVDPDLT